MCKIGLGQRLLTASLMIGTVYSLFYNTYTVLILLISVLSLATYEWSMIVNNIAPCPYHELTSISNTSTLKSLNWGSLIANFLIALGPLVASPLFYLFTFIAVITLVSWSRAIQYSWKCRLVQTMLEKQSKDKEEFKRRLDQAEAQLLHSAVLRFSLDFFGLAFFSLGLSTVLFLYKTKISFITVTFFQAWQTDNGGLFFGKACGKHKLAPRISPKKTLEGLCGAYILSLLTAMLEKVIGDHADWFVADLSFTHYFWIAIITATTAVVGDLIQSMMKRAGRVKDSSSLFPGHGGMLDRLDSLVLTAPAMVLYLSFNNLLLG